MNFRAQIAALWAHLGLPAPTVQADGAIVLSVDDLAVVLRPSPDERQVMIALRVGVLSDRHHEAAEQIAAVLRLSLEAFVDHRACLRLGPDDERTRTIIVEAVQPIGNHSAADLAALIEDALELHRRATHVLSPMSARPLVLSGADWNGRDIVLHP